jgi:serine/threonine protein kinase
VAQAARDRTSGYNQPSLFQKLARRTVLSAGARLGPYEVVSPLGAGGMGEVYRARDTKLGREVALKVLPEAFTADAQRLARFERDAKVLASLNHPHIAQFSRTRVGSSKSPLLNRLQTQQRPDAVDVRSRCSGVTYAGVRQRAHETSAIQGS